MGAGSREEPQFGAWPTLSDPFVKFTARSWHARFGSVAAGLGICLVPALAAPGVPADVVVVPVEDPNWLGRTAIAVTAEPATEAAQLVISTLREIATELQA